MGLPILVGAAVNTGLLSHLQRRHLAVRDAFLLATGRKSISSPSKNIKILPHDEIAQYLSLHDSSVYVVFIDSTVSIGHRTNPFTVIFAMEKGNLHFGNATNRDDFVLSDTDPLFLNFIQQTFITMNTIQCHTLKRLFHFGHSHQLLAKVSNSGENAQNTTHYRIPHKLPPLDDRRHKFLHRILHIQRCFTRSHAYSMR